MNRHESKTYQWLRKKLLYDWTHVVERIENILVSGMFDVHFVSTNYGEAWIEIKSPQRIPARIESGILRNNHPLSIKQRNWGMKTSQAGGRCGIFVDIKGNGKYLMGSETFEDINLYTIQDFRNKARWFVGDDEVIDDKIKTAFLHSLTHL